MRIPMHTEPGIPDLQAPQENTGAGDSGEDRQDEGRADGGEVEGQEMKKAEKDSTRWDEAFGYFLMAIGFIGLGVGQPLIGIGLLVGGGIVLSNAKGK